MSTDDAKSRLLAAAGPVFAELGFQAATVREICREAGVNVAAINYYFGDKEGLYVETLRLAHQEKSRLAPLPDWPPHTPAEQKLRDYIANMLHRVLADSGPGWHSRLLMREILNPTGACQALARDYFHPYFDALLRILDEILPGEMPPHRRIQVGFSIVGQCVFYRLGRNVVTTLVPCDEMAEHYDVASLADHIAAFTLAALGRGKPLAAAPIRPAQQGKVASTGP